MALLAAGSAAAAAGGTALCWSGPPPQRPKQQHPGAGDDMQPASQSHPATEESSARTFVAAAAAAEQPKERDLWDRCDSPPRPHARSLPSFRANHTFTIASWSPHHAAPNVAGGKASRSFSGAGGSRAPRRCRCPSTSSSATGPPRVCACGVPPWHLMLRLMGRCLHGSSWLGGQCCCCQTPTC